MVSETSHGQYYTGLHNFVPSQQVMTQPHQVLPKLSKINLGIEIPNVHPTIANVQFGSRIMTPGGYMQVAMPNQQINWMQQKNNQLPGINQFVSLIQNSQFGQRPDYLQIPSAYLQQAQLKNLLTVSQGRVDQQPYVYANRERQQPQDKNWYPNNPYNQRPN